ncbi:hypothetical protein [Lonepinella sp. BR2474]|uniref:hypothetical protein n=1 Tax=Lonepinella sp. BR2474 TaxID=3434548 RepID=UPI003F6E2143
MPNKILTDVSPTARWVLLLPASIIAYFVAKLIVYVIIWMTLSGDMRSDDYSNADSLIWLFSGAIKFIFSIAGAFAYTYVFTAIAPVSKKHNLITAIIAGTSLFILLYVVPLLTSTFMGYKYIPFSLSTAFEMIASFIGVGIVIYQIYSFTNKTPLPSDNGNPLSRSDRIGKG